MLLEHQVIWCQSEAAGQNHGCEKSIYQPIKYIVCTENLKLFFYHPDLVTII